MEYKFNWSVTYKVTALYLSLHRSQIHLEARFMFSASDTSVLWVFFLLAFFGLELDRPRSPVTEGQTVASAAGRLVAAHRARCAC